MPGNNASGNRSGAPKPITVEHMMLLMEALRKEENRKKAVNGVADVAETDVALFALAWASARTWEDIVEKLKTWSIRPQHHDEEKNEVVVYWCKFKSPEKIKYYHPYMYTLFTGIFAQELLTLRDRRGGGNYPHTLTNLTCDDINKLLKSAVLGVHGHGYTHGSLRAGALLQAEKLADKHLGDLPQAKKERMLCVLRQKPHKSFPAKSTVQAIEDATAYLTRSDVLPEYLLDNISYSPLGAPNNEGAPEQDEGSASTQEREDNDPADAAEDSSEERGAATPITRKHMYRLIDELLHGRKRKPTKGDVALFVLAWSTASRWGDIWELSPDGIPSQKNGDFILYWGNAPKDDKEPDPDKPHSYVKFTGAFVERLQALRPLKPLKTGRQSKRDAKKKQKPQLTQLETGGEEEKLRLTHLETGDVISLFADSTLNFDGQHYTAHSIKRGALQEAAMLAYSHDIEPKMVCLLAKHKHKLLDEEYNDPEKNTKRTPFRGSDELPRLLLAQMPDILQVHFDDPANDEAATLREEVTEDGTVFITAGGLRVDPAVLRQKNGKPYARSEMKKRALLLHRFEDFCKKNGLEVVRTNIPAFIDCLGWDGVKAETCTTKLVSVVPETRE